MLVTNVLFLCLGACVGGAITAVFNSIDNNKDEDLIDFEEFIKNMNKKDETQQYPVDECSEKIEIEEI